MRPLLFAVVLAACTLSALPEARAAEPAEERAERTRIAAARSATRRSRRCASSAGGSAAQTGSAIKDNAHQSNDFNLLM